MTRPLISCPRGCGLVSHPGPIAVHVRACLTPMTLERIYEIGSVDTSSDGCWLWESVHGGKYEWYPRIAQKKVMQLVCEIAYGPKQHDKLRPLHSCDNMRCVRVDHLRWGTQAENVQDMYDRGRRRRRNY